MMGVVERPDEGRIALSAASNKVVEREVVFAGDGQGLFDELGCSSAFGATNAYLSVKIDASHSTLLRAASSSRQSRKIRDERSLMLDSSLVELVPLK